MRITEQDFSELVNRADFDLDYRTGAVRFDHTSGQACSCAADEELRSRGLYCHACTEEMTSK